MKQVTTGDLRENNLGNCTGWHKSHLTLEVQQQKGHTYDNFIFLFASATATEDLDNVQVVKEDTMNLVNSQ